MKIHSRYPDRIPALAAKCLTAAVVLCLLITLVPHDVLASKRVVVLYFEDHSRFDDPTGCGCLPTGPFGKIFGRRKEHQRWRLKEGFTELLNRKLKGTGLYEPVSQDELMDAMAHLGLSKKVLQSDPQKRGVLAEKLQVEALIAGDIRKFNQERVRANAARLMREGQQQQGGRASYVGGVQIMGNLYIGSVKLDMRFYATSGNEIDNPKISASKKQHLSGTKIAALEAVVTEEGTEFRFGQTPGPKKKFRPIVDPAALNKIKFGSPEYDKTLFGLVTQEALGKVVLALRENIGPGGLASDAVAQDGSDKSDASAAQVRAIEGAIIYVDPEDPEKTYINIGSAKGVVVHHQLRVYTETPLIDPNTGDILGSVSKPVGVVEVVEVSSDRLSRVRIVEGLGKIQKGDRVKLEQPNPSKQESELDRS